MYLARNDCSVAFVSCLEYSTCTAWPWSIHTLSNLWSDMTSPNSTRYFLICIMKMSTYNYPILDPKAACRAPCSCAHQDLDIFCCCDMHLTPNPKRNVLFPMLTSTPDIIAELISISTAFYSMAGTHQQLHCSRRSGSATLTHNDSYYITKYL